MHSNMASSSSFTCSSRDQYSPHAIVIPPLQFTVHSGTYTYSSPGLLKDGYNFDPNVEKYLPLLEPLQTKARELVPYQPQMQIQPLTYWKAQCAFRNLLQTGTIEDLQQRLRHEKVGLHGYLAKATEQLNEEFWAKNAKAKKEIWDRLGTDERKACANAVRFLTERFQNAPLSDVVTLKIQKLHREAVYTAARPLGLCTLSVDAPLREDGSRPVVDRWVVVGHDQSSVKEEIQRVSREARSRQRSQDATAILESTRVSLEARLRQRLQDATAISEPTRTLSQTTVEEEISAPDDAPWDVVGLWAISCPFYEEGGRNCSLDIRFAQSSIGGEQMWAKFDFVTIQGIIRFISDEKFGGSSDEGSDEENSYNIYAIEDLPEENFYFDVSEKPSPNFPTWEFRWCGKTTYDGKVVDSEGKSGCVTFAGVGGTSLTGYMQNDDTKKVQFTGHKAGPTPGSPTADWEILREWRHNSWEESSEDDSE